MSKPWPKVKLGEALKVQDNSVAVSDLQEVNLAGVYSFARGLFKRGPMQPGETSYKTYNRLVTDDFVISVPKAWEGALARVTPEFEGWYLSPVFPTFRADRTKLLPEFLEWYCKRSSVWGELQRKSRGIGARRESVHPDQFLSLEIPLPPISEQRRIVARIEELSAQIQEARTLRQQAAEEAAVMLPSGMADIFHRLALKHPQMRLDQLCDVVRGGSPRPAGSPMYYGGDISFIKVGDITKDEGMFLYEASATVNALGREHSRYIENDTLMLTNSGATLGVPKITKIAGCFNDGSQAFLNLDASVQKEYLYYYFKSKTLWFRERLARGQGQPNLNTEMTKQML